jgi:hypothetical protein
MINILRKIFIYNFKKKKNSSDKYCLVIRNYYLTLNQRSYPEKFINFGVKVWFTIIY